VRRADIARRGGETIAEHIGDDDQITLGVERATRPDQPLGIGVLGAVGGRIDDDIAPRLVEPTIGLVGELRVPQSQPGLQRHVAELEDFVIA
jgi:hypothetical protein